MNTIKLKLITTPKVCRDKYITVEIDGFDFLKTSEELEDSIVYFRDFYKSSFEEGDFLIFTCACGIADCGGWDLVTVKHVGSTIFWSFNYDKHYSFTFEKDVYQKEALEFKGFLEINQPGYCESEIAEYPE